MLFLTAVLALNQWSYMTTGRSKIHNSSLLSVKMKRFQIFSPFLTYTERTQHREKLNHPGPPNIHVIFTYAYLPLNTG